MTEQSRERLAPGSAEWFKAWLPARDEEPAPKPKPADFIAEVRTELKQVAEHLLDPTAAGVRASLPHLERAIAIFGTNLPPKGDWQGKPVSTLLPELDALRVELALANRLFENAYLLQAGWAAQAGLNMDGTARQLLYGRRGDGVTGLTPASAAHEVWEA